jgi:hypothetical protein
MPGLPEDQVQSVSHFLQRVRKELERAIRSQRGTIGHFMKSDLITKRIPAENSDGGLDRTYVFCCIPYHQLAPYSPLGATSNARLHPVMTLLQSKYPSTSKQRDFEQAVRSVTGTPSNHVFNTSNLWCLIINNSKWTDTWRAHFLDWSRNCRVYDYQRQWPLCQRHIRRPREIGAECTHSTFERLHCTTKRSGFHWQSGLYSPHFSMWFLVCKS